MVVKSALPLAAAALLATVVAASKRGSCAELGCGGSDASCSCADWCLSSSDCCADYDTVCPVAAPKRLQLSDVNLVVTTDLHSWIEGREHEPRLNATIGHVVSLVERLRERARLEQRDVFFFDNGDVNDGTGLSASNQNHVQYLAPIMRLVPYDALGIGNHELYQLDSKGRVPGNACAITGLRDSGYLAERGERYITSNVVWAGTGGQPVGNRFATLWGSFGTNLLVFSFLYNMYDHCDAVDVEDVGTVVRSSWFLDALLRHGQQSSAIVVLAHMDYRDPLVDVIYQAIRKAVGSNVVIQVLAGHSHIRGFRQLDDFAAVYEAGCKLDTLGFVSIQHTAGGLQINHTDLDGNTAVFAGAAGTGDEALMTPQGQAVNSEITATQEQLGLKSELGCAQMRYRVAVPMSDSDSLWAYYVSRILPGTLLEPQVGSSSNPLWGVVGRGALVYDVYPGPFTLDDAYKASPFGNYWFVLRGIAGTDLAEMLMQLNRDGTQGLAWAPPSWAPGRLLLGSGAASFGGPHLPDPPIPNFVATGPLAEGKAYDLVYCDFDAGPVESSLRTLTGRALKPEIFHAGSNTSSVLADWFSRQPCPETAEPVHM